MLRSATADWAMKLSSSSRSSVPSRNAERPAKASTARSEPSRSTGTPTKLLKPCPCHHDACPGKRASSNTSATSSMRRSAATQPTPPCPNATEVKGRSAPGRSSETARSWSLRSASSATQNDTKDAPVSSAAARAMAPSTRRSSSDEETTWFTRDSARSRAARPSSASRRRALVRSTHACSPMAASGASSAASKRRRSSHHTRKNAPATSPSKTSGITSADWCATRRKGPASKRGSRETSSLQTTCPWPNTSCSPARSAWASVLAATASTACFGTPWAAMGRSRPVRASRRWADAVSAPVRRESSWQMSRKPSGRSVAEPTTRATARSPVVSRSRVSSTSRAAEGIWAATVSGEPGVAAGVGGAFSLLIVGTASIQGRNPAERQGFPRLSRSGSPPSREVLGQDLGEECQKAALVIGWRHAPRGLPHRLRRLGHGDAEGGGGRDQLEIVEPGHDEARGVAHKSLDVDPDRRQALRVPDQEALDEAAQAEKITGRVDDLEGDGLLIRVGPRGEALGETVQLVVAVEERVHGGVGDGVVDLPEDPPRQRQRHQIAPGLVVPHQRPVVEDHRRRDAELVAVTVHARRHAAGGDRDDEAPLSSTPQPGDQRQIEIRRVIE